jgi:hypothetical protein
MTRYRIELWNPHTKKYQVIWTGREEYALTMMNKSYNVRSTRRLIKTTEEVVYAAKKGQYVTRE